MLKWVDQAPLSFDANISLRYMEKLTAGVTYRAGGGSKSESIDGLVFFQVTPKFGVGLGYDYSLTKIKQYQSGTVEVLLRYDLHDDKGDLENPRYFKKK